VTRSKTTPTSTLSRFAYFFATPWWRAVWFGGALIWCLVFQNFYNEAGLDHSILAVIGLVPIFAFVVDVFVRDSRLRRQKQP